MGLRYSWLTAFHDVEVPTNDSLFVPSLYNPAKEAQLDSSGNLIPGSGATYLNYGNGLAQCGSGGIPQGCYKQRSSLQFRLESYNTFNHPQWTGINLFCSGTTAPGAPYNGSQNIGNGEVSSAANPRILQLGLKFLF